MKLFIIHLIRFATTGIIFLFLLLVGYFIYDPFKVIYPYKDYSNLYVIPNRDYISTEMFIHNHKKYNYNSFIFGSSRTIAFKPASWKNYLTEEDVKPFVFDASGESVYGIYTKLKYLDSIHAKIDNTLIILCRDISFHYSANHKGHLFIKHPATSNESALTFQIDFIRAYLSPGFIASFYGYTFFKQFTPGMIDFIEIRKIGFDTITNEINVVEQDKEIAQHPDEYYKKKRKIFYTRGAETTDSLEHIKPAHKYMLKEIKRILVKNKTKYKVVISPLYEQIKINRKDFFTLQSLFGNELYDFSGKNSYTEAKTNYYEISHFRPLIGDSIMHKLYCPATD